MHYLIIGLMSLTINIALAETNFVDYRTMSKLDSGVPLVITVADRANETINRLWINSKNLNKDTLEVTSDVPSLSTWQKLFGTDDISNTICVYEDKEEALNESQTACMRTDVRNIFVESVKAFVIEGPIREAMDKTTLGDISGLHDTIKPGRLNYIHAFNVNTNEVVVILQQPLELNDRGPTVYAVYDLESVPVNIDMNYLITTAYFLTR